MSLIINAASLARVAHRGQIRKYTGRPYLEHPARVAGKVATIVGADENMIAAAFLHDVLEDTQATPEDVLQATNGDVLGYVQWLTNPSKGRADLKRADRKAMDREHLMNAPNAAKVIKMVDRIDNLLDIVEGPWDFQALYAHESILLAEAIGSADPHIAEDLLDLARKMKAKAALP
jgi:(p)ppGpp synthase/HD superfamily hydrolase